MDRSMIEALRTKLHRLMTERGFELTEINDEPVYHSGDKYVRIVCCPHAATVELAGGLHDAENNLYEDIDLYQYDYMAEHGMKNIYEEMRADIVKYVFGEN